MASTRTQPWAVIRIDTQQLPTYRCATNDELLAAVTVTSVWDDQADAESDADRLAQLNGAKGSLYQATCTRHRVQQPASTPA